MANRDDLLEAIRQGDIGKLKQLLATAPDLAGSRDEQGVSILLQALYHRRSDIAEIILGHDPPLDLHEAAAVGQVDRVQALLADDPRSVDAFSADGFTALHLAAFFDRPRVVELLLEQGADASVPSANAMRVLPLHSAAAAGSVRAVEALLASRADPNARQPGGFTPLMSAASIGDEAMLRLLLSHGADPRATADDGKTAADFARERGHETVSDLLVADGEHRPED
jgi:ankyrin repeat protein